MRIHRQLSESRKAAAYAHFLAHPDAKVYDYNDSLKATYGFAMRWKDLYEIRNAAVAEAAAKRAGAAS